MTRFALSLLCASVAAVAYADSNSINTTDMMNTGMMFSNSTNTTDMMNMMFHEGDTCGVTSSDFFNYNFGGQFRVAGRTGCTLANQTGCYCAPDLADSSRLSEWKWQCNGMAKFGPVGNKTCPATVPILKVIDSTTQQALGVSDPVPCNQTTNPTGRPGDEVCSYSDCDQGGNMSSICGCVNLTDYGMGEGVQWFCMQSTCSCGLGAEGANTTTGGDHSLFGSAAFMMTTATAVFSLPVLALLGAAASLL